MRNIIIILLSFLPLLTSAQMHIVKLIVAEYRVWYLYSDGNIWGTSNNAGSYIKNWGKPAGVTSWSYVHGGFNYFIALDQAGNFWNSLAAGTLDTILQVPTDTTGSAFSGNWYVDSYSRSVITIRADSSLWYGNQDNYSFYYAGGSLVTSTGTYMAFTQFSPGGVKFKKVVMGGTVILGLTNDGKVYKWVPGNLTPTIYSAPTNLPRPAIDIFASAVDVWGCIIPNATGSQTMGYPYMAGFYTSLYGGGPQFTTPTSVVGLWGITVPIKEISVDWNSIHYIDSTGKLYGCGWNPFGEVGNGQEFIGHYDYPGFPGYGWSLMNNEHSTGIPVQIGSSANWKHLYKTKWFGFYVCATDNNDSLYAWGRNKTNILGNGVTISASNGLNHPNMVDILTPTRMTPISAQSVLYDFVPPSLSAGSDQSISTTSTTLTASGQPARVFAHSIPAPNGIDTIGYHYNAWTWTKLSGPTGGTITSPNAQSTTITGLQNGTYSYQVMAASDHSELHVDTVQILVSLSTQNWQHHSRKFKSKQL